MISTQRLSDECMAYIKRLMREAARDYRMDARLSKECVDDVSMLTLRTGGVGRVRGEEGRDREDHRNHHHHLSAFMCQD